MQVFDQFTEYIKRKQNSIPDALARNESKVHRVSSDLIKKGADAHNCFI